MEVTSDGKFAFVVDMSATISVFDVSSGVLLGKISDIDKEETVMMSSQFGVKRWRAVRMDDAGRLFAVSRANVTVM